MANQNIGALFDRIVANAQNDDIRPHQVAANKNIGKEAENATGAKIEAFKDKTADVYKAYQSNIRQAQLLKADILKGLHSREEIRTLFVKAATAIALMTNDQLFEKQVLDELQHYL